MMLERLIRKLKDAGAVFQRMDETIEDWNVLKPLASLYSSTLCSALFPSTRTILRFWPGGT